MIKADGEMNSASVQGSFKRRQKLAVHRCYPSNLKLALFYTENQQQNVDMWVSRAVKNSPLPKKAKKVLENVRLL